MEKATFGAGCFWGVEDVFRSVKGVIETTVGYTGGILENPTYIDMCSKKTKHAEAVEVIFDPEIVSYEELLDVFWKCHDPTQLNRQGPDVGSNYRSAIFYHTLKQRDAAIASKENLQNTEEYKNRIIVTEITKASKFYRAEEYHQQYFKKCGMSRSCHLA